MADLSLYLTNVNVSIGQNMNVDQVGKKRKVRTRSSISIGVFFRGLVNVCVNDAASSFCLSLLTL